MAESAACICARRPARRPARRFTAASSTACCSRFPIGCGDVDSAPLFEDPLYVAFPAGEAPGGAVVDVGAIDESRMLLLEDGHCLKDHALSACNRPDLRAHAAMMGTSLHTLVQMVDNGLGLTFIPAMAIEAGILDGTAVDARPLRSDHGSREIALIWRRSSPRENEFQMLASALRRIIGELVPGNSPARREKVPEPA